MAANPTHTRQTPALRPGSRCRAELPASNPRQGAGPTRRGEYGSLGRIVRARRRLRDGVYDRDDVLDRTVDRLLSRLA